MARVGGDRVLLDPARSPRIASPRSWPPWRRRCASERTRRAVFLDRDGTIIEDAGYLADPAAGAAAARRGRRRSGRLNRAGLPAIVVTNQSGIARGLLDETAYRRRPADWTSCWPRKAPGSTATTTVPIIPTSPDPAIAGSRDCCSTAGRPADHVLHLGRQLVGGRPDARRAPGRAAAGRGLLIGRQARRRCRRGRRGPVSDGPRSGGRGGLHSAIVRIPSPRRCPAVPSPISFSPHANARGRGRLGTRQQPRGAASCARS